LLSAVTCCPAVFLSRFNPFQCCSFHARIETKTRSFGRIFGFAGITKFRENKFCSKSNSIFQNFIQCRKQFFSFRNWIFAKFAKTNVYPVASIMQRLSRSANPRRFHSALQHSATVPHPTKQLAILDTLVTLRSTKIPNISIIPKVFANDDKEVSMTSVYTVLSSLNKTWPLKPLTY
jgi:hypothetical protein